MVFMKADSTRETWFFLARIAENEFAVIKQSGPNGSCNDGRLATFNSKIERDKYYIAYIAGKTTPSPKRKG